MFAHNFSPILIDIGPVEIRWYGLVWALGFLLAYLALQKNKECLDMSHEQVESFFFYFMLSVLVGARLFHVLFWGASYYFTHPQKILAVWEGGLAFHGGLVGGIALTYFFTKKHNLSWEKIFDVLTIPAALALAFGRLANFMNGELWGGVTTVSWCFTDQGIEGCRHPSTLYAAAGRFLSFFYLYYLSKKEQKDGYLFWQFVLWMGVVRIIVDFFRADQLYLALTAGQWFSVAMVVVSVYFLKKKN